MYLEEQQRGDDLKENQRKTVYESGSQTRGREFWVNLGRKKDIKCLKCTSKRGLQFKASSITFSIFIA